MQQSWRPTLLLVIIAALALPGGAGADQSSQPSSPLAGHISAGQAHDCAVIGGAARCWGFGGDGRLGYGGLASIGDGETPGSVGPVDLGPGAVVDAITAGSGHTCALLADGTVHCWGFGGNGRLGYANENSIGDDEPVASAGAVALGAPAIAISAGEAHTCALLVDRSVFCWGYGGQGRLGYAGLPPDPVPAGLDPPSIGDNETPLSAGPVQLGGPAIAISAGGAHTCALMVAGTVRCWGSGALGALGTGNTNSIGDNELPDAIAPVDLGGHTATAIDTGDAHTCALLDDRSVRCWGSALNGELGLGSTNSVGAAQTPGAVPSVDLAGATAKAIAAGGQHTCALMDDGGVRCWGRNQLGQLGYGRTDSIGDNESPASAGAVALGAGRSAVAIAAGAAQTCALLDDGSVRCWGYGANGRLGYCNETTIGDDELPAAAGPVDFSTTGAGCVAAAAPVTSGLAPAPAPGPGTPAAAAAPTQPGAPNPRAAEAARRAALRSCLRAAARRPKRSRAKARQVCLRRHGRTPGRVGALRARDVGRTKLVLSFTAAGSDGRNDPAARTYVIKQSAPKARTNGRVVATKALCKGTCRFRLTEVGTSVSLTVTDLRPRTTYSYAVAARDNVSNRLGPRVTIRVRTR